MNMKDKLSAWLPTGGYQTTTVTPHHESLTESRQQNQRHDATDAASEPQSHTTSGFQRGASMVAPPFMDLSLHELRNERRHHEIDQQSIPFSDLRPWTFHQTPFGVAHELHGHYVAGFQHGNTRLSDGLLHSAASLPQLTSDPRLSGFSPEKALFLDIEATGLSHGAGTYAFLIGLGEYTDSGDFLTHQLALDDPSNEAAVLARLTDYLTRFDYLVSFNGKSYDLSVLQSRMILHRFYSTRDIALKLTPHLDLVHLYRAIWKRAFSDCRLQTLEKYVLDFVRHGDVPGELVPALYFQYLHLMDAQPLEPILEHNLHDVLSMAGLVTKLLQATNDPDQLEHPEALAGLAILLVRRGANRLGLTVGLRAIDLGLSDATLRETLVALVKCCKRLGETAKLIQVLELFCQTSPSDPDPWIQLGFCHERWTKNFEAAYYYTQRAHVLLPPGNVDEVTTIERRMVRLRRKLGIS